MPQEETDITVDRFGYKQELRRVLPLSFLVFYGLAYLCPVTVYSTFGLVAQQTHGMVALSYIFALIGMVFTAYAYMRMVRAYPIAGSVYSYVQRSINPHLGFLAGWAILMDYMLLPMINYMLAAIFIKPVLPSVPAWIWIVGLVATVTVVNYIGINLTAWASNILIIIQMAFVAAFMIVAVYYLAHGHGAGTLFDIKGIYNAAEIAKMGWSPLFLGASVLVLSFLGFDGITTVAEEAIDPEKNVGKAIMITCLGAGFIFIVVAYLLQLAWPDGWLHFKTPDSGAWEIIVRVTADWVGVFFTIIYVIGCFASAMASSNSAARLLFGMGRDGVLPKPFARVHPKLKTPTFAIIVMGIIGLTALGPSLALAASLINFGALAGFTMVNLSVIAHYYHRHKNVVGSTLTNLIVPLIGAVVCYIIWWSLSPASKCLGFTWLAIGVIMLAFKTSYYTELPPEMKFEE